MFRQILASQTNNTILINGMSHTVYDDLVSVTMMTKLSCLSKNTNYTDIIQNYKLLDLY